MKALLKLCQFAKTSNPSKIIEAYKSMKPGIISGSLSGNRWRYTSMGKTLDYITDPEKLEELSFHASNNLKLWEKEKIAAPQKVEVVNRDWGDATLEATKKHGKAYPVLNMANPDFPGGAVLEGGRAQEENMWHRTSCALSLLSKGIYFDEAQNCFRYDPKTRKLLEAQEKMNTEELGILSKQQGEDFPEAFKVFFNDQQQICFRGPEVLVPQDMEGIGLKDNLIADSAMSFSFLPKDKIFPFYELRSAAPELTGKQIDWKNKEFLTEYTKELRRRIGGQLDTLILHRKPDVILGAWGCGSFKNDPRIIARIYREEIEKRSQHFQHIVFPIINTDRTNNFEIFQEHLDGLKLGKAVHNSSLQKTSPSSANPYSFHTSEGSNPKETPKDESKEPGDGDSPPSCNIL
ncbi:hypothetical protein EP47_06180 [Legionella norrlandica]|uniref:Microbial-type PARG catalytic domain-containing protein n=1 Tax=Legionella norrlandica TaxID=1498499 RepID=A0A0A2SRY7_9GAMM|nr:poly(ADP-ribose) glycohydrolase domain-containing protein [Legionella norrlandica]KGP62491.1 hypothetical protein EP47_06180 [Legionella norrlandica]